MYMMLTGGEVRLRVVLAEFLLAAESGEVRRHGAGREHGAEIRPPGQDFHAGVAGITAGQAVICATALPAEASTRPTGTLVPRA